ncbi:hypothetical protein DNI29_06965 [Hymenobacter sediminis]|uniref:hypothetical protein n=1 Tax=Hymenobacter sediminis TaxID=2218621 RepID=UPI000F4E8A6E|nr:hypothetical protein [Hymenobacter sediminis]RPD48362.1 hypothetical protein DNI29_06965 [Hymenobacter sediminis]
MTILRTLSYAALLALMGVGAASCINPPEYSDTPEISFKSLTSVPFDSIKDGDPAGSFNRVVVTISFKDGDGDLGLSDEDTNPPYARLNPDGSLNKYNNNYFLTLQEKNSDGTFSDFVLPDPGLNYNSRYPRLEPDSQGDRKQPLKGDLSFKQTFGVGSPPFVRGRTVRFRVYIVDRALHESNEVFTDPITVQ